MFSLSLSLSLSLSSSIEYTYKKMLRDCCNLAASLASSSGKTQIDKEIYPDVIRMTYSAQNRLTVRQRIF